MNPSQRTLALTIAYDGAPFAGFARQEGLDTVQGRVEDALRVVLRRDVETVGAGRTDAGVHALGQVVSTPLDEELDLAATARSLSALVGKRIAVREARLARPGFSARFDALSREYRYRLACGPVPPLFTRDVSWWVKREVDEDAMRESALPLLGEHDFRSFCVADSAEGKRTIRRLDEIEIFEETQLGERLIVVRIVGNAFLHSMVRVIVGTLVEVGSGRRDPAWTEEALEARDRSAAGATAPAQGLTLWSVEYPSAVWL